jgi:transposase
MLYCTNIGLDVHARSVKAAAFISETGEVIEASFSYDPKAIIEWMGKLPGPVRCVYESGPTGFDLLRKLRAANIHCVVGAASKMLRPSGDKIKNDKRDAVFLARMLAVGNIVEVYVPYEDDEAARDLTRAREDVRHDLVRAKQLLSKFLLRKGIVYGEGKTAWTKTHRNWLNKLTFTAPVEQLVLSEYLMSVEEAERKRERLDTMITELARSERWKGIVQNLCLLRGISVISAFSIASEIGDFSRFCKASAFYSFLGLVPSLNESGESSSHGPITKTGNNHVRKLLIESAWHHARRYRPAAQNFPEGIAPEIVQFAKKANLRLYDRTKHFQARKLNQCKANAAIAREMAGFIWALANMTQ